MPESFGRRKRDLFSNIVVRIKLKAASWSTKFLSKAGKMVMLCTVLAAMPSHAMSCFKLPISLCLSIQSALTRFWWDSGPEKRKMSWASWKKMAKPKGKGGLGFKDITSFNDALLAKLSWRILKNPTGLLARCLLGKYCTGTSFLKVKPSKTSSHGWRSVLIGRDLLMKQLGWLVGSGAAINIWDDPWMSWSEQLRPYGPSPEQFQYLKFCDMMIQNTSDWNLDKVELVLPFHKHQILKINPNICGAGDELVWLKSPTGEYSTRSSYRAAMELLEMEEGETNLSNLNWNANVWNIKTAEKIKVFLWNSLPGALPVGEQFAIRNIPIDALCVRCKEIESIDHVLFKCPFAKKVWERAPWL